MTRQQITEYVAAEWAGYSPSDCSIDRITALDQLPRGAADEGAAIGDWLIATKDGVCAEVVRIGSGGAVEQVYFKA